MLLIAQQLQLVLVFSEQSLEAQVLADDRQNLTQQISLPQTLMQTRKLDLLNDQTKNRLFLGYLCKFEFCKIPLDDDIYIN